MKFPKLFSLFLSIIAISNLIGQGKLAEQPRVISYELVKTYSIAELEQKWKEAGIPKAIAPIKYSVDVYEVIYNTCWHDSSCVKASGLYFVPKGAKKAPMMVYHHGTQIEKARTVDLGGEIAICMGFATDGYAVAYSDYLGLGKGEKSHLYIMCLRKLLPLWIWYVRYASSMWRRKLHWANNSLHPGTLKVDMPPWLSKRWLRPIPPCIRNFR